MSRNRVAWALAAVALVGAGVALAIFLSGSDNPRTLGEAEAEGVLEELPYELAVHPVPPPPHASGAIAGRVVGPGGTVVHVGVSLGRDADPVQLGPRTATGAFGGETFRVSDDTTVVVAGKPRIAARLATVDEWKEAARIVVDIEEQLCRATTGKSCSI
jgi:hypothetical protein